MDNKSEHQGKEKENGSLTEFFTSTIGTLGSYVYAKKNRGQMLAIHSLGFMEAGIQILIPIYVAKWLVETKISQHPENKEDSTSLWIGMSGLLLGLVLPRIRSLLVDSVKRNVQEDITLDMVKKTFDGELDELMGQPTGKPAAIVSKNYGSVQNVMPIMVSDILPSILETFGISIVLSSQFGKVGTIPTLVLLPYLMGAIGGELYSILLKINNQGTMVEAFGKLLEVINNYTIAHQYGNLDLEINKLETSLSKLGHSFKSVHRAEETTATILAFVTKLGMIGAMSYVYYYPPTAEFWPEDFLLFGYYILRANFLAESLPTKTNALFTGLIDTHMIVDFFKKTTSVPDPHSPLKLDLARAPSIEFKNVSFNYGSGKPGISNISFTIQPGQKIAIMGTTGSGKSTLLKLLQRFYDFDGDILINNVNIKAIAKNELRSYLAVVSQDSNLTSDTLFNNIKYGDRNASEDDVFTAARFAKLDLERHRFFADAMQEGANFSGGEKQRANIARALLKHNSYIFLLDEPTSSLDQQTAKEVHNALDQLTTDTTTIMVTHDPNAVMHVDTILYMEKGQIVEMGTFKELMALKDQGAFYKQFLIQCDKLGIPIDSINPVEKTQTTDIQDFLSWKTNRRDSMRFLNKPKETAYLESVEDSACLVKKFT